MMHCTRYQHMLQWLASGHCVLLTVYSIVIRHSHCTLSLQCGQYSMQTLIQILFHALQAIAIAVAIPAVALTL